MLSIGLLQWYININNTILDIIHCPVFYLEHNDSETGEPDAPETETSSIYGAQLNKFHLKAETEYSHLNTVFQTKDGLCLELL
jgi:hypothetical protein